ncbi:MAG: hypothetical protein ACI4VF_03110 [Lachnospirales bacterium]
MKKSNIAVIVIVALIIVVGVIVGVRNHNNSTKEANASQTTTSQTVTEEEKIPVPEKAQEFFNDYTNLMNEASRKVETGEVKEERYFDLLSKGIEIGQMKENYEKNGLSDELEKQIEEVKPYLYEFAEEIGSELKDKFK